MLLFPNRDAGLDLVDNQTTSLEGCATMDGGDTHPDGKIAQLERTHPMHADRVEQRPAGAHLAKDARPFFFRERPEGLVVERQYLSPFIAIPDPTLE